MKKLLKSAAMLCMGVAFAACSSSENEQLVVPSPSPQPVVTRSLTQEEFVKTGNDFAFNLLRDVEAVNEGESFVLSPLSITYALGMLNEGATGETRQQIMRVMGFEGVSSDTINDLCHTIMQQAPLLDDSIDINIANGIFLKQPFQLQESYQQTLSHYYDAETHALDFYDPASLTYINDWCSQKTNGMIPHVLDELSGICYLINAIYFKGEWTYSFDPDATTMGWFWNKVEVPYMNAELSLDYVKTEDCQVVRMPFGNESFGMYILLPVADKTVEDVLSKLSTEKIASLEGLLQPTNVVMRLPRFETKTHTKLNDILKQRGMILPFSERWAQLDRMIQNLGVGSLYVSQIFQDAVIEVQEKGAKAAAVTVVNIEELDIGPEDEKIYFTANRPFVYLITDKQTGAIYFAGVFAG